MATKARAAKQEVKDSEQDSYDLYIKIIQELLSEETEVEKREKKVLLDKLKIYIDGKDIVMDNSKVKYAF